jgi:hypothetical protein
MCQKPDQQSLGSGDLLRLDAFVRCGVVDGGPIGWFGGFGGAETHFFGSVCCSEKMGMQARYLIATHRSDGTIEGWRFNAHRTGFTFVVVSRAGAAVPVCLDAAIFACLAASVNSALLVVTQLQTLLHLRLSQDRSFSNVFRIVVCYCRSQFSALYGGAQRLPLTRSGGLQP